MAVRKRCSVKEAAEALGKSEDTIRDWCRSGRLPAKNIAPAQERAVWQIFEDTINDFGADNDNCLQPPPKLTKNRKPRIADSGGTDPMQEAEDLLAKARDAARNQKGRR
jgi:hypothetical protein